MKNGFLKYGILMMEIFVAVFRYCAALTRSNVSVNNACNACDCNNKFVFFCGLKEYTSKSTTAGFHYIAVLFPKTKSVYKYMN